METPFTGSWRSVRSNIPGYHIGGEILRFSIGEHVWEIAQRHGQGRPSVNRFVLKEEGDGYRLCLIKKDGEISDGTHIEIKKVTDLEIVVTPQHGFSTVFKRED
jgi:hypothetical protein